ncbi:MAG: phosphomannomutase, phosphomannomutase [Candidatus Saccharibacteria bacterium]|nr:phosphomannomutase, phosphomannomutase [Candidatus Saccharibacteria bacterium]
MKSQEKVGDIISIMTENMIAENDIRGTSETGLTVEFAWNVGKAVADWLATAGSVIVLYVPAGQPTAHAIIEGVRLQGRNAIDGGMGDKDAAAMHVKTSGLSGAIVVSVEESTGITTIQVIKEDGNIVTSESGLQEVGELVDAGNFVPAAVKGELTAVA